MGVDCQNINIDDETEDAGDNGDYKHEYIHCYLYGL